MARFTSGKFAPGICDRCGFKYKLLDLKEEWTGLLVCDECWDAKDPLEFPTNFPTDPESVRNPSPDDDVEASDGVIRLPSRVGSSFAGIELECERGTVTVTVT